MVDTQDMAMSVGDGVSLSQALQNISWIGGLWVYGRKGRAPRIGPPLPYETEVT